MGKKKFGSPVVPPGVTTNVVNRALASQGRRMGKKKGSALTAQSTRRPTAVRIRGSVDRIAAGGALLCWARAVVLSSRRCRGEGRWEGEPLGSDDVRTASSDTPHLPSAFEVGRATFTPPGPSSPFHTPRNLRHSVPNLCLGPTPARPPEAKPHRTLRPILAPLRAQGASCGRTILKSEIGPAGMASGGGGGRGRRGGPRGDGGESLIPSMRSPYCRMSSDRRKIHHAARQALDQVPQRDLWADAVDTKGGVCSVRDVHLGGEWTSAHPGMCENCTGDIRKMHRCNLAIGYLDIIDLEDVQRFNLPASSSIVCRSSGVQSSWTSAGTILRYGGRYHRIQRAVRQPGTRKIIIASECGCSSPVERRDLGGCAIDGINILQQLRAHRGDKLLQNQSAR
ncbi:hypothetical protein C8J57DRAFT_1215078 [Mycena rebaudengoi]|nr:hypothetical protein C8J57DRAFT_1215078 [Mycena rebaudengoi]